MSSVSDCTKLISQAARKVLENQGLFQKGRSRIWIDDNGWFLIVVEFQPSSWTSGTYLNVGINYLWNEKDYLSFDYGSRVEDFVAFAGDKEKFTTEIMALAEKGMEKVKDYRKFCDSINAKECILRTKAASKTWELYNKMMMCGFCGDSGAKEYFEKLVQWLKKSDAAWEQKLYMELIERIEPIIGDADIFREYILEKIMRQRSFWCSRAGMKKLREQVSL